MKSTIFFITLMISSYFLVVSCKTSQVTTEDRVELISHSAEHLDSLLSVQDRPVVVFFHTSWCGYCQNMKQTTWKDSDIIQLLNDQYYFVSFDAEQKRKLSYRGELYEFIPQGRTSGTHELALKLATVNGEINYPTTLVLDSSNKILFKSNSFTSRQDMREVLLRLGQ